MEVTITNIGFPLVGDSTPVKENTMEVDLVSASIDPIAIVESRLSYL